MKTKNKILAAMLGLSMAASAQTQVDRWVNILGGNNPATPAANFDAVKGMVEDGYSNLYVIGNFTGSFNIGIFTAGTNGLATGLPLKSNITSHGGQDIFVGRFDRDGKCTFMQAIGGTGDDEGNAICFNGTPTAPSEFYITGKFYDQMNIGSNVLYATTSTFTDAFIIKYTTGLTTTPAASWWTNLTGGGEVNGLGIVASSSNVFVTGYFKEWMDLPSGSGSLYKTKVNGTTGGYSTAYPGYLEFPDRDFFIARFSTAGVYSDAVHSYRSDEQIESHGIALSGSNLYITGTFKGSIDLGGPRTASGVSDIFVASYPTNFTNITPPTNVAFAGGPSTLYQPSPGAIPYHPDGGYGIAVTGQGVFVIGRIMGTATFGSSSGPIPSVSNETYMFLAHYDLGLTSSTKLITGTDNTSEAYGIYALGGSFSNGYISTILVTGAAKSDAKINGSIVKNNTFASEYTGFLYRMAYSGPSADFDYANVNNFTDGLSQNLDGLDGTGGAGLPFNTNVRGYALTYRVGCGVRIGGSFSAKTSFGDYFKSVTGANDAFIIERENAATISTNTYACGGNVTLTGTGASPYTWYDPSGNILSTSNSVVVPVPANGSAIYSYAGGNYGTCPTFTIPVTVIGYPLASTYNAGPDQTICTNLGQTGVVIGLPALPGGSYNWTPIATLNYPNVAQPTASPASTTVYNVTFTDKCGNTMVDNVMVTINNGCRLAGPHRKVEAIEIYPNPGTGRFHVKTGTNDLKDVVVFDYTGKIILEQNNLAEQDVDLDISGVTKGIYFVKVTSGEDVQMGKVVIE